VLIDDLTIVGGIGARHRPAALLPLQEGQLVRTDRIRSADNRERLWQIVTARGLVIRYCPEIGHIQVRLSVPRLAYPASSPWAYNFPLGGSLPALGAVAAAIARACGLERALGTRSAEKALALHKCGISRISYTVDVPVGDATGAVAALSHVKRLGNAVQTWGSPPHACQWQTDLYKVLIYSKEHEIRARRGTKIPAIARSQADYNDPGKAFRARLADEARGIVRFETTLRSKAIRETFGINGGFLPNYEYMTRPEVGRFFLGRERDRLRVRDVFDGATSTGVTDAAALALTFEAAVGRLEAAGKRLSGSGGARVSCNRIAILQTVYGLTGVFDDTTLCRVLRLDQKTLAARRRNLLELGLPPLGDVSPHSLACLREFLQEFERFVPVGAAVTDPQEDDIAVAPWLDMLPEDEPGEPDAPAESVCAEEFQELLEQV